MVNRNTYYFCKSTYLRIKNKKAVDIIICKNKPTPELFFIEVKYHKNSHGRLGFGSGKGVGFQPEILSKKPEYFEKNLRWILFYEDSDKIFFLTNEKIRNHISKDVIGEKFNNIRKKLFKEEKGLTENELIVELKSWLIPD
jgi:hypothetical protein